MMFLKLGVTLGDLTSRKSFGPFDLIIFAQGRNDALTLSLAGALHLLMVYCYQRLWDVSQTVRAVNQTVWDVSQTLGCDSGFGM